MIWPPQGQDSFAYKTPCCECPVICSFVIPRDVTLGGTPQYDSATLAQDAMNDQVSDCIVYREFTPNPYDVFSVEAGTSVLEISYVYSMACPPPPPPPLPPFGNCGADLIQWFGITAKTGMISVPYSVATTAVSSAVDDIIQITVYDQTYSVVTTATDSTQGDASGTFTITLPAGSYIFKVEVVRHVDSSSPPFTIAADFDFEFVPDTLVCQVTAAYDNGDGGTDTIDCCTFQCASRMGAKCGFTEFSDPSSPPKYYRTVTVGGAMVNCRYTDEACVDFQTNSRIVLAGACGLDPVDSGCGNGLSSQGATYTTNSPGVNCGDFGDETSDNFCQVGGFISNFGFPEWVIDFSNAVFGLGIEWDSELKGKTSWILTGDGACRGSGASGTNTGELTCDLSDEDTTTTVIDRVQAEDYGDWGNVEICRSAWSFSDTTNEYTEAKWRVTKTNLDPLTEYEVTIEYWRSVYGADSYSHYASVVATETTDADGNFLVSDDIPIADGYETVARCNCKITKTA